MKGSDGSIFALGDCTSSQYAPTAQVASQQGAYLARVLKQKARRDSLAVELAGLQKEELVQSPNAERKEKIEKIAKQLEKQEKVRPFSYSHQGSLAYVFFCEDSVPSKSRLTPSKTGTSERRKLSRTCHSSTETYVVISLLVQSPSVLTGPFFKLASAGMATFLFWRSAYLSTLFSLRNRVLVANDWLKVKLFGR